ncbi:hypothetical protein D3C71_1681970 [compost metagenome]
MIDNRRQRPVGGIEQRQLLERGPSCGHPLGRQGQKGAPPLAQGQLEIGCCVEIAARQSRMGDKSVGVIVAVQ